MEVLKPGDSEAAQLEKDLDHLLGAFGSSVSLEDIASAYYTAHYDVSTAAEMLCNLQGSTPSTSADVVQSTGSEVPIKSEKEIGFNPPITGGKDYCTKSKQKKKKCTISAGTVSSMITRDYSQYRPSRNPSSSERAKPLKLICYEPSVSDVWNEKPPLGDSAKNGFLHEGDEVIHIPRLGDESQPERYVSLSGHNYNKSVEQQFPEKLPNDDPTNGDKERLMIESGKEKERQKRTKEALEALFNLSKKYEQPPKVSLADRQERITRGSGYVVCGPPEDAQPTYSKTVSIKQQITKNEEDEDSYQVMRQAFREHMITMKEFYKSSAEALALGDHSRADKMLEEGNFFKRKAQEADERSAHLFLQGENEDDDLLIDLSELELKESIQFLKIQLAYLASLPTFQSIIIKLGSSTEDQKGDKKKRLVMKLLEKRSIKWTEESDGKVIKVLLGDVPKCQSFAKKRDEDRYNNN